MFKPVLQEVLFALDCVFLQMEVLQLEEKLTSVQEELFWVFAFRPVLQPFPFLRLQPLLQLLCPQKYKLKSNQIQFIIRILPENDLLYSMLLSWVWFLNYSVIFFRFLSFFLFGRFSKFQIFGPFLLLLPVIQSFLRLFPFFLDSFKNCFM